MKKIIGVMGPSKATSTELRLARKIGKLIAQQDAVLLTGGMGGVMEEASRGAKEAHGLVLAICPTYDKSDLNTFVDIPVMTGMRSGRNFINILSSDIIVAIGHTSAGTLSEIAFALQLQKPMIIIGTSVSMQKYLKEFKSKNLTFAKNYDAIEKFLKNV